MRTVGIIVEYNPMHNGHLYHLQQSKKCAGADAAVAVMSGHFLQRGEPALADKWARTDMALAGGVDLVLELPIAYAVQPAEWFAYGSVATLQATGVVDALCFGSEQGDLRPLEQAAAALVKEPIGFARRLREELKAGRSYPAAYACAAGHALEDGGAEAADTGISLRSAHTATGGGMNWLAEPNNSLGLHYMLALRRLRSDIEPFTIGRRQAGYHDENVSNHPIASATAIRRLWAETGNVQACSPYIPQPTLKILEQEMAGGRAPMGWERFVRELLYQLHLLSPEALAQHLEVTEGLEHRIKQALQRLKDPSVEALLNELKTKRYTRTKLQRTLAHILLHHDKFHFGPDAIAQGPSYIRVLGFSDHGRMLLKRMKKTAELPVVLSVSRENAGLGGFSGIPADTRATALYANAFTPWNARAAFRDYYEAPRRI
ncbi:nucleotidyltransferase [Paenibacillus apiarius]|uniref:nucleotidyltransferase n=1 Tax=Paenibacillus apiarius TaxID=46240 RepID=UPI001980C936|nr:nucleotidyltransferase [Paenibacillus apiarius]MBN3526131.1 nucleotidyltransferase [Paenibacillus apiarius]